MTRPAKFPDGLEHLAGMVAARFFGGGVEALFPDGEDGPLLRPVPWDRAARLKHLEPWNPELVAGVLSAPPVLVEIDPVDLHAGQPSIIGPAVRHYAQGVYERTGQTYEPGSRIGNRFPLIYCREAAPGGRPAAQKLILAGHHRSAVALALGRPVRAIVVEGPWGPARVGSGEPVTRTNSATPSGAAALTPLLFLGSTLGLDHVVLNSVTDAVAAVEAGATVLVGDEAVGLETMLRLGVSAGEAADRLYRATHVVGAAGGHVV